MIRSLGATFLILSLLLALPLSRTHAQDTGSDGDTTPEGIGAEAAEALGEDRGQTEEEQLEDILSSEENEYDLINAGNVKINYSFNYSVNSSIRPRQRVVPDSGITAFNLTTDSQHNASHRLSFRYGFLNNVTLGMNVPIITKWNTTTGEATGDLGDISLSTRLDPFVTRPGQMSTTFFGSLSLPTGRSPWEIDQNEELSTGSGGFGLSGGVNVSKTVDPVVAFGSFNVNYGLPISGLSQVRQSRTGANILREVRPGPNFSFGAGMAYSLSYDVSLTFSINYGLGLPTELEFDNGRTVETSIQPSGTLSISSGWRLGPEYITNFGVGVGLTRNSPDMSFNVSFPILMDTPAF